MDIPHEVVGVLGLRGAGVLLRVAARPQRPVAATAPAMNPSLKLPSIPLWDAHWPNKKLLEEQDTNPRSFERGFRQTAFTDEERMFPHFQDCFTPGIVVGEIIRRAWPTFAGVDLAGDKRPGNVIFVASVDPTTERRYPVEVLRGNWKSPEMAAKLAGVRERHPNLRVIMVENNGYQQSLVDWIKQTPGDSSYWYMVESYTTGFASKVNPIYGLPGLDIEFKNKAWVIPSGEFEGHPPHCRCGWCVWKGEFHDYPMGATTDTVMAQFFCREAISKWGTGATMGVGGTGGIQGINDR